MAIKTSIYFIKFFIFPTFVFSADFLNISSNSFGDNSFNSFSFSLFSIIYWTSFCKWITELLLLLFKKFIVFNLLILLLIFFECMDFLNFRFEIKGEEPLLKLFWFDNLGTGKSIFLIFVLIFLFFSCWRLT